MKKWKEMFIVVNKALEIAKIHKRELNNIIFLGGQTRIPKIEEMVKNLFWKNRNIKKFKCRRSCRIWSSNFRKSKFNNRIYNFKIN